MGDLVVDFNQQNSLKLKKAKTAGSNPKADSKKKPLGFQIGYGGPGPINQKKVVATQSE